MTAKTRIRTASADAHHIADLTPVTHVEEPAMPTKAAAAKDKIAAAAARAKAAEAERLAKAPTPAPKPSAPHASPKEEVLHAAVQADDLDLDELELLEEQQNRELDAEDPEVTALAQKLVERDRNRPEPVDPDQASVNKAMLQAPWTPDTGTKVHGLDLPTVTPAEAAAAAEAALTDPDHARIAAEVGYTGPTANREQIAKLDAMLAGKGMQKEPEPEPEATPPSGHPTPSKEPTDPTRPYVVDLQNVTKKALIHMEVDLGSWEEAAEIAAAHAHTLSLAKGYRVTKIGEAAWRVIQDFATGPSHSLYLRADKLATPRVPKAAPATSGVFVPQPDGSHRITLGATAQVLDVYNTDGSYRGRLVFSAEGVDSQKPPTGHPDAETH